MTFTDKKKELSKFFKGIEATDINGKTQIMHKPVERANGYRTRIIKARKE